MTKNDLIALRPGNGISPMKKYDLINKKLKRLVNKFDLVNQNDIDEKI